ncbi:hypothetical protein TNCV_2137711 [Trichonephila clavipes]|nr:hypothetical protein TNCV_2137711 [Trichonephila clavipes]
MTLHSPTENSLSVLNHKILEANSQVQNVKLGGHQTCLSMNRLWHELCDMLCRLIGTKAANLAYENREQRHSRLGPIRRIYALLDDRFDELPNHTENKSLDSC